MVVPKPVRPAYVVPPQVKPAVKPTVVPAALTSQHFQTILTQCRVLKTEYDDAVDGPVKDALKLLLTNKLELLNTLV